MSEKGKGGALITALATIIAALISVFGFWYLQSVENVPKDQEAREIYKKGKSAEWNNNYSEALRNYFLILEGKTIRGKTIFQGKNIGNFEITRND